MCLLHFYITLITRCTDRLLPKHGSSLTLQGFALCSFANSFLQALSNLSALTWGQAGQFGLTCDTSSMATSNKDIQCETRKQDRRGMYSRSHSTPSCTSVVMVQTTGNCCCELLMLQHCKALQVTMFGRESITLADQDVDAALALPCSHSKWCVHAQSIFCLLAGVQTQRCCLSFPAGVQ